MKFLGILLWTILIGVSSGAVAPTREQCISEIEGKFANFDEQAVRCAAPPSFLNELKGISKSDCKKKVDTKLTTLEKCKDEIAKIRTERCGDVLDFMKQSFNSQYHFVKYAKFACNEDKATRDIYAFPNGCVTTFYRTCVSSVENVNLCE
jgi:hypothetical protein